MKDSIQARDIGAQEHEADAPAAYAPLRGTDFDPAHSAGLFIGINEFKEDPTLSRLNFAVDDAIDLASTLVELGLLLPGRVRFALSGSPAKSKSTVRLESLIKGGATRAHANAASILKSLGHAAADSEPRGYLFVHACTHGFDEGESGYLCHEDSLVEHLDTTGIPLAKLQEQMRGPKARPTPATRRILFVDACRNKAVKLPGAPRGNPVANNAARQVFVDAWSAVPEGVAQATLLAADVGCYSYEADGNGFFTRAVIDGLRGAAPVEKDGVLYLSALAKHVGDQVAAATSHYGMSMQVTRPEIPHTAGRLPLAVDPRAIAANVEAAAARAATEATAALAARKRKALACLKAAFVDEDNTDITEAMVTEVSKCAQETDGELLLLLLVALERLMDSDADKRYVFAARDWPVLRSTFMVSPKPESMQTPQPTPAATAPQSSLSRHGSTPGDRAELTLPGGVKMAMRWCPPGTFTMGSPSNEANRYVSENQVQVRLSKGFWMAETEVTVGQFQAFVEASGYRTEAEAGDGAHGWDGWEWKKDKAYNWRTPGFTQSDSSPVTCVSWNDAKSFADWARLSLPTEAQWEYACRAGTTTPFHFGSAITPEQVNYDGNDRYGNAAKGLSREKTTPVGSFPANAWGLRDMHGNVLEWCADWYDGTLPGGTDPTGPSSGRERVLRGGSWVDCAQYCRSAARHDLDPSSLFNNFGFRVLSPVQ